MLDKFRATIGQVVTVLEFAERMGRALERGDEVATKAIGEELALYMLDKHNSLVGFYKAIYNRISEGLPPFDD